MNVKIVADEKPKHWRLPWWVSLILLGLSPFYLLFVLYQDIREFIERKKEREHKDD